MFSRQSPSWNRILGRALAFLLAFSAIPVCRAILLNRTIDSKYGDSETRLMPIYSVASETAWNDETCAGCFIQPDPFKAFDHTWMSATYHPSNINVSLTLQFTGVAVWVFFILSNANSHGPSTTTNTQCNFTLDGQHAGYFSYDSDMTRTDMVYNATVFSKAGLDNTPHQLIVSVNDYPDSTFLNFDYAIYTADVDMASTCTTRACVSSTDSESPSSLPAVPSNSETCTTPQMLAGIIVGSILGAVALTTVVLLLIRFSRKSRLAKAYAKDVAPEKISSITDSKPKSVGPLALADIKT